MGREYVFMPHKQESIDRHNAIRARMDLGIGESPMEYCLRIELERDEDFRIALGAVRKKYIKNS